MVYRCGSDLVAKFIKLFFLQLFLFKFEDVYNFHFLKAEGESTKDRSAVYLEKNQECHILSLVV